jgi:5-dehydro-4-deoxyglucarate dehydratase
MLHESASANDAPGLAKLMSDYVVPLYAMRARRKGYEVSVMKAMMDVMGLAGGPVRPPLPNVRPEETQELRAMVECWKAVI